jgi:hypothetical protein
MLGAAIMTMADAAKTYLSRSAQRGALERIQGS